MIRSEDYAQLAQRCARLALASPSSSLSDALMRLASDYVMLSHRQSGEQQRQPQLDPRGFGD
jgi:hypothetical protein